MPLHYIRQSIIRMKADVIAFPAGTSIHHPGQAEKAILEKAGQPLFQAIENKPPLDPSTAGIQVFDGYPMKARYLFRVYSPHPEHSEKKTCQALKSTYTRIMQTCTALGCTSVAIPLFGAGSRKISADLAFDAVRKACESYLEEHEDLDISIVLYDKPSFLAARTLHKQVDEFINDHYVHTHTFRRGESDHLDRMEQPASPPQTSFDFQQASSSFSIQKKSSEIEDLDFDSYLEQMGQLDESFCTRLLGLIDRSGMSDAQCYKRANIDRKLFSKIRSNPGYHPSKNTVIAFAIALSLSLEQARELLASAGYAFSPASKADLVVEFCLLKGICSIHKVNELLFSYDQPLLGS